MPREDLISNAELTDIRERLIKQLKRRGTYTWWDPLVPSAVGTDRTPREILPSGDGAKLVSDSAYNVANPSNGALEETRNRLYRAQGDNPGGQNTDNLGNPKTSAARLDQDEIRNLLVGLAKIHDIDLYYGRDEKDGVAFRDTSGIHEVLESSETDIRTRPITGPIQKYDPNAGETRWEKDDYGFYPDGNTGHTVTVPVKIPSGQRDGEEIHPGHDGPDPTNFYDDYGAEVDIDDVRVMDLTNAERNFVPMINDNYMPPTATPASAKTSVPLGSSAGVLRNNDLIDYTATSQLHWTNSPTNTPGGKRPIGGWIENPSSNTPMESLPGQSFKRSYSGGVDGMVDRDLGGGKSTYGGKHPSVSAKPSVVPPITFGASTSYQPELAYHPQNPYVSAITKVFQVEPDENRDDPVTEVTEGGKNSIRFGLNPRNPQVGDEYTAASYRQVYQGVPGTCRVACTGMCYQTCDSECSESCQSTCWNRCGDACVSSCISVCTGCLSLCYDSCKTKCENIGGLSCLNVGAEVAIFTSLGQPKYGNGNPWPQNNLTYKTHACHGCSYTCQYYPNYKTTCWDALCQNLCFYSCYSYCSTGCYGGCINNQSQHNHSKDPLQPKNSSANNSARYRTGRGQACRENCVADCVGDCQMSCDGTCTTRCFNQGCTAICFDNCSSTCVTTCGDNCEDMCRDTCTGSCSTSCRNFCVNNCANGCVGNCSGNCWQTCNTSCHGSCEDLCENQCRNTCFTTCVIESHANLLG